MRTYGGFSYPQPDCPAGQSKALPIPLAFAESNWLKIGLFLYEWLSRTQIYDSSYSWRGIFPLGDVHLTEGDVQVNIPDTWVRQGEQLFPGKPRKTTTEKPEERFYSAQQTTAGLDQDCQRTSARTGRQLQHRMAKGYLLLDLACPDALHSSMGTDSPNFIGIQPRPVSSCTLVT